MNKKKGETEPCYCCDVCGEEHGLEDLKDYNIKGEVRKICEECATAIKGMV